MSDTPWLSIVGLGEDGLDGLSSASRNALERAEVVIGPPRHLELLPELEAEQVEWPVPFKDGLALLDGFKGRRVVVLASGDPFWFGAGSVIAKRYKAGEWQAFPGVGCFSLAAARLGWAIDSVACLGLHAAPFERLRADMAPEQRAIATLRDGEAVGELAKWLTSQGFGESTLHVMEALGGPHEQMRTAQADAYALKNVAHPVCIAVEYAGRGEAFSAASGRADHWFENDGQMTKRPMRALTLSALAPKPGETLWDLGAGSGSISIEWLLSHASCQAVAIEKDAERAERIKRNAATMGVDRLKVMAGISIQMIEYLPDPDVVFIGGGADHELLETLTDRLPKGTRLVVNAVTMESEMLVLRWQKHIGGELLRVELSEPKALGSKQAWNAAYPVTQWSCVL